jgi:RimJ/RimL family protein N-acetyltransferase
MIDLLQTSHPDLVLTDFRKDDMDVLVRYLNDPELYRNTLSIPYPYAMKNAIAYFRQVRKFEIKYRKRKDWVLRIDNSLIGGVGALLNFGPESHKTEIGYWIASPFRGKGMMSAAVNALVDHLFTDWHFVRLEANVFTHNPASCRVLEKCGFTREGTLKKAFLKDGIYMDSFLYARVKV